MPVRHFLSDVNQFVFSFFPLNIHIDHHTYKNVYKNRELLEQATKVDTENETFSLLSIVLPTMSIREIRAQALWTISEERKKKKEISKIEQNKLHITDLWHDMQVFFRTIFDSTHE